MHDIIQTFGSPVAILVSAALGFYGVCHSLRANQKAKLEEERRLSQGRLASLLRFQRLQFKYHVDLLRITSEALAKPETPVVLPTSGLHVVSIASGVMDFHWLDPETAEVLVHAEAGLAQLRDAYERAGPIVDDDAKGEALAAETDDVINALERAIARSGARSASLANHEPRA